MNYLGKQVQFKNRDTIMSGKVVNTFGHDYVKENPTDTFIVKIKESFDPEDNPADVYVLVQRKYITGIL